MAEDGFDYTAHMRDEISASADHAAASVHKMGESAEHADGLLHRLSKGLEGVGEEFKKMTDPVATLRNAFESASEGAKEFAVALVHGDVEGAVEGLANTLAGAAKALDLVVPGLGTATAAMIKLEGAAVSALVGATEFALESAEFKENMVSAFAVVEGTAEEGEAAFAAVEKMAIASHAPVLASEKLAQDLALAGEMNADNIAAAVEAASSLNRLGLQGGAEKLAKVIEQSESIGHFQLPKKLQGLGVSVTDLTADLARRLHTTTDVITAQLKAGKIATEVGVAALLDQINLGKVGQAAAKKFDLKDIATDWHNFWTSLTEDVNSAPLVQGIHDFVGAFQLSGGEGSNLKDTLVDVFNTIIRWTGEAVTAVTLFGQEMYITFLDAEIAAAPAIVTLKELYATWAENTAGLGTFNSVLKLTEEYFVGAAGAAGKLVEALHFIAGAPAKLGQDIGAGLAIGMGEGADSVAQKGVALGEGAVEGARAAVKGHSPSEVMMDLGLDVAEGFEIGVQSGSARAQAALGDLVAPPRVGGDTGPRGGDAPHIEIHWHGDVNSHGHADADEIASLVESKFADVVERIVLELGG